mmetsp:Transcript_12084/g.35268  ORF Transcript_12084/g.35268 Transcript_12084/m.35268 type:complete len:258 (+) Transcript_12084:740-1513(+)
MKIVLQLQGRNNHNDHNNIHLNASQLESQAASNNEENTIYFLLIQPVLDQPYQTMKCKLTSSARRLEQTRNPLVVSRLDRPRKQERGQLGAPRRHGPAGRLDASQCRALPHQRWQGGESEGTRPQEVHVKERPGQNGQDETRGVGGADYPEILYQGGVGKDCGSDVPGGHGEGRRRRPSASSSSARRAERGGRPSRRRRPSSLWPEGGHAPSAAAPAARRRREGVGEREGVEPKEESADGGEGSDGLHDGPNYCERR